MKLRLMCGVAGMAIVGFAAAWAGAPTTINDFFLPGSQPNQSGTLENPDRCLNCHAGYSTPVEPGFNWQGSMMAQAARDPLFFACMAIANQDAPGSGDLCIRCHSPKGWLEGRSEPTDGSLLTASDREGLQCDFCHRAVKPSDLGVNPYPGDPDYTSGTYPADQTYLGTLPSRPATSANGMYVVTSDGNAKRGPYVETVARHAFMYSPFHQDASLCGTCHDVSNPAFTKNASGKYVPNPFDSAAPDFDPYTMFPVERTFSEWKVSSYNTPAGVYAPQFGGNKDTVRTCQDCHMRDVTGKGCNKNDAPVRTDLALHDMTGGNTFIPAIIDAAFPGETNAAALDSGIVRARRMLQLAASMDLTAVTQGNGHLLTVQVTNETGHKLPSGYPEGRRIWINVRAYNATENLIYESGAYDPVTAVLTHDPDVKIYEIKPGLSQTLAPVVGEAPGVGFHFVLNDSIYSDNRIPPRGFTNSAFDSIQSPPVAYSYADGQYWDETDYLIPGAAASVTVTLYYQTTTKEYVEFLRDENVTNHWGQTLYDLWSSNGKSAPEVMNIESLQLSPIAGNQPPILAPIGAKAVAEVANLQFSVSASDADGPAPALTTSPLPTGATFTPLGDGTGTFDWTPTYEQAGLYSVTFYATDDSSAVDSEVVAITVTNVNRLPVLSAIGPQTVAEGDTLTLTVSATDPDADSLILTAGGVPANATFTDNYDGTGTFRFTPDYSQAGSFPVLFTASDGTLNDSELVVVTVTEMNRPPVLAAIGPRAIGVGQTLQFAVSATDPDGSSPALTAAPLPGTATFDDNGNGTGTFFWTPVLADVGAHAVLFIASDGSAADSELVTITVTVDAPNLPPVFDPVADQHLLAGEELLVVVSAYDPEGGTVALALVNPPANASFVENGWDEATQRYRGTFSWTPTVDQAGTHNLQFTAADDSSTVDLFVSVQVDGYLCGDTDSDGSVNVGDLTFLVNYLFRGGPAPAFMASADGNGDGTSNVGDLTYFVNYLFKGGEPPICEGTPPAR